MFYYKNNIYIYKILYFCFRFFEIHFLLNCSSQLSTYLYLLTARCTVLLEQLTVLQPVKKFPAFHGTRRFITALTSVRHLSLSWAIPIQSTYPHPTSCRSVIILSTHLHLGLPSGLFPSGFPHQEPIHPLPSPIRSTCSAHLIILDFITRTVLGEHYRSFSSSLSNLLYAWYASMIFREHISFCFTK
jgi:hypothetical protein